MKWHKHFLTFSLFENINLSLTNNFIIMCPSFTLGWEIGPRNVQWTFLMCTVSKIMHNSPWPLLQGKNEVTKMSSHLHTVNHYVITYTEYIKMQATVQSLIQKTILCELKPTSNRGDLLLQIWPVRILLQTWSFGISFCFC